MIASTMHRMNNTEFLNIMSVCPYSCLSC